MIEFNKLEKQYIADVTSIARLAHGSQKRKYTGEDYITHPMWVSEKVYTSSEATIAMVLAALLHDVIEDTAVTPIELLSKLKRIVGDELSKTVLGLVMELTDVYTPCNYPHYNRYQRKKAECRRLANVSIEAKIIKYADLIHNTMSIVENDEGFARIYLEEKADIIIMMITPCDLYRECHGLLRESKRKLGMI